MDRASAAAASLLRRAPPPLKPTSTATATAAAEAAVPRDRTARVAAVAGRAAAGGGASLFTDAAPPPAVPMSQTSSATTTPVGTPSRDRGERSESRKRPPPGNTTTTSSEGTTSSAALSGSNAASRVELGAQVRRQLQEYEYGLQVAAQRSPKTGSNSSSSAGHLIFCGSARACGNGQASEAAHQLSQALAQYAPKSYGNSSSGSGSGFESGHVVELHLADLLPPPPVSSASLSGNDASGPPVHTGKVATAAAVAATKAALNKAHGGVLLVCDAGRVAIAKNATVKGGRTDAQAAVAAELERSMAAGAGQVVVALAVAPAEMQAFVGSARDLAAQVEHVVHFNDA